MQKEMIGQRIRELRISKTNMSQEDFASKIGMDRTYLSKAESGKQNLTIESICLICFGLHISLNEFFSPFTNIESGEKNEEKSIKSI